MWWKTFECNCIVLKTREFPEKFDDIEGYNRLSWNLQNSWKISTNWNINIQSIFWKGVFIVWISQDKLPFCQRSKSCGRYLPGGFY